MRAENRRGAGRHACPVVLLHALVLALPLSGCSKQAPSGFAWDFARLGPAGEVLDADAPGPHECVLDRRTGLLWEVKLAAPGLRHSDQTFSWYSDNGESNGGEAGLRGAGDCVLGHCDTESYVAAVNAAGLCGRTDWRLPSRDEALTLLDPARIGQGATLDPAYFPETAAAEYWTATTFSLYPQGAWAVDTVYGQDRVDWKTGAKRLLLVSGSKTAVRPKRRGR
jgi:hypothetical protein